MFAQLPTSKIIALKFTLYVFAILLFFVMIANSLFFRQWYMAENKRLGGPIAQGEIGGEVVGWDLIRVDKTTGRAVKVGVMQKFVRTQWEILPYSTQLAELLTSNRIYANISKIDDEYVLYKRSWDAFHVVVVTRPIEAQQAIFRLSLIGTLLSTILTYLLSHYFVKSSLGRLSRLTDSVKKLQFDTLDTTIPMEGPDHDEVRVIATALQESLSRINTQKKALHDFVAHASHELKTPLMSIGSQIDYLIKSQSQPVDGLAKIKTTTKSMSALIEQLLTLAKLDATQVGSEKLEPINVSEILTEYIANRPVTTKSINLIPHITPGIMLAIRPWDWQHLINNLIDNAYTYTDSGSITVTLDKSCLIVQDTGRGILAADLPHIREKFWQADTSKTDRKNVGLGLSLVKSIALRYRRKLAVLSTPGEGSEFKIHFTS